MLKMATRRGTSTAIDSMVCEWNKHATASIVIDAETSNGMNGTLGFMDAANAHMRTEICIYNIVCGHVRRQTDHSCEEGHHWKHQ